MRIGIDINDIIRNYSLQFAKYYQKDIGSKKKIDLNKITDINKYSGFKFENKEDYYDFLYERYVLEIFGYAYKNETMRCGRFNEFLLDMEDIKDREGNKIEFVLLSSKEYSKSIGATYFFLSRVDVRIPRVVLCQKDSEMWEHCDVLLTCKPDAIKSKPNNKVAVKFRQPYNRGVSGNINYADLDSFLTDENNISNIKYEYSIVKDNKNNIFKNIWNKIMNY